ncbi:MAG: SUF system NifU family Fe-S cluster assembly protein [Verrucomicrobia bacterium]|nr:SUF system NifU family Fe-S cluster assembly protein [Verrucomicrobiota bacterium]
MNDLSDLYQEVILDHSRSPRNYRPLEAPQRQAQGHNPLCGDQVTIYLAFEGDVIKDISFQGSGCAISKASASLLTESLKGRSTAEVKRLFDQIHALMTTGQSRGADLGKMAVFAGVHKFPARVKCAMLPWRAVVAALEDEGRAPTVSTE